MKVMGRQIAIPSLLFHPASTIPRILTYKRIESLFMCLDHEWKNVCVCEYQVRYAKSFPWYGLLTLFICLVSWAGPWLWLTKQKEDFSVL